MANLKATSVVLAVVGVFALAELGRCHPIEFEEHVDQRPALPRVEAYPPPTHVQAQPQPRADLEPQRPVRQAPCCGGVSEAPTEPNLNRPKRQNVPPNTPCCGVQQPTKRQADFPEAQKGLQRRQTPQNCCGHLTERPVRQASGNLEGSKLCCGQLEGEQPQSPRVRRDQIAQTVALPDASTPCTLVPPVPVVPQPAVPAPVGMEIRTKRQVPQAPAPVPVTMDTAPPHPEEAPKPVVATPEIRSKRQEPAKAIEQDTQTEKRQTEACCGVQQTPEQPGVLAPQPATSVIRQGRQAPATPCCGVQAEPRADVAPAIPAAPAPTAIPPTV